MLEIMMEFVIKICHILISYIYYFAITKRNYKI